MSNFLALANVTAALQQVLLGEVQQDVSGALVTIARPDGAGNANAQARVNLYLYQVTPNVAARNADLPTRDDGGRLMQRPRAALDLHYLLTFYGDEAQLVPQRLLGSVARTLHVRPVLTQQAINAGKTAFGFLAPSNLDEEFEQVKFTPTTLSLEELSRLWAVFFQTQYTLSATYQASVIFVEPEDAPSAPLPVLERKVYALPFQQPVIEKVKPADETAIAITAGSDLLIEGSKLRGELTQVNFSGSALPVAPLEISDKQIRVTLPAELRAGVQGVQLEHLLMLGSPATPHAGFESNVAAFALAPSITLAADAFAPDDEAVPDNPALRNGTLTLAFVPPLGITQRVKLLLNERNAPDTRPAWAYSINAPTDNGIVQPTEDDDLGNDDAEPITETKSIAFALRNVAAGDYLVRAQVDGATSALQRETDPNSPEFNEFSGPKVTIA